jgi:hypothetical protein
MIYGRPRPAVGTSGLVELHDQAITVSLPGICSEAASVDHADIPSKAAFTALRRP